MAANEMGFTKGQNDRRERGQAFGLGRIASHVVRGACWFSLVLAATACRIHTEYRGEVTKACEAEADGTITKRRIAADGGAFDWSDRDKMCQDCCHAHDLSNVEPGYCACGKMGLDALMK